MTPGREDDVEDEEGIPAVISNDNYLAQLLML